MHFSRLWEPPIVPPTETPVVEPCGTNTCHVGLLVLLIQLEAHTHWSCREGLWEVSYSKTNSKADFSLDVWVFVGSRCNAYIKMCVFDCLKIFLCFSTPNHAESHVNYDKKI